MLKPSSYLALGARLPPLGLLASSLGVCWQPCRVQGILVGRGCGKCSCWYCSGCSKPRPFPLSRYPLTISHSPLAFGVLVSRMFLSFKGCFTLFFTRCVSLVVPMSDRVVPCAGLRTAGTDWYGRTVAISSRNKVCRLIPDMVTLICTKHTREKISVLSKYIFPRYTAFIFYFDTVLLWRLSSFVMVITLWLDNCQTFFGSVDCKVR